MLSVNNLKKSYGRLEVLKAIDFKVEEGKVFGFLGRNGAGKSTTMNIVSGLIDHNGGNVKIYGKELKDNKKDLMQYIGYLPENPVFYEYMSAEQYLKFIGNLSSYPTQKVKSRTNELLELVKLTDARNRKIGGFSRGMRQRLGLAVALYNHPKLLILDEPTSALDPEGRLEMVEMIENAKHEDMTVFLSSHILSDVERVCDEVSILHEGKILLNSSLEELQKSHLQPIFDIELEGDVQTAKKELEKMSWSTKVESQKNGISVYVSDFDLAKDALLKELVKTPVTITSYKIRKKTLEDIFIGMVSKNGDL
ncbi:ABC transporter ATP-binding protein [Proteinivorax hydrogeniformans]|uniref:ABC transporter ATP-binding protein n=1 Tax=Proteinivorax hydrogeniformans TaxID=1826727 RepID=A0AAU8HR10_9FIRM